jgi:cyclophilin family peptidyl-prolyl cis-trans isomerase
MTRTHLARMLAALAIPVFAAACTGGSTGGTVPTIASATPETLSPAATQAGSAYPPGCPTSQPAGLTTSDTRTITINTPKGDIVIAIQGSLSPIAAGNFVALASCGYYDGVVFHRVVPGFVIQAGDGQFGRSPDVIPGLVGGGGPPYTIKDEPVTGTYTRGTVAMAKTPQPDTASSQFFIVLKDLAPGDLEARYQIFGHVTSGMDAVDAIAAAADQEKPTNPVPMTKVTVANP